MSVCLFVYMHSSPNGKPHFWPSAVLADGVAESQERFLHLPLRLVVPSEEEPGMPAGGTGPHCTVEHLKGLRGTHRADHIKGSTGVVEPACKRGRGHMIVTMAADNHYHAAQAQAVYTPSFL